MAQSNKPKPDDLEQVDDGVLHEEPYRSLKRIHYSDGTYEDINPNRPGLLTMFSAAHKGKNEPETTAENMWLLWQAAGRQVIDGVGSTEAERVDAWVQTIDEIETVYVERTGKARR